MENGKIKINVGLASIILVACLFAGWQTLLLVTILMFMFCDIEDKVKEVAISVITFYVGFTIVSTGWNIIVSVIDLIISTINNFSSYIRDVLDLDFEISIVMTPIRDIVSILKSGMSILLKIAELAFIVGILTGKSGSSNPLSSKINEYVNKALNYVNGNVNMNMNQPTPMPPMGAQVQQGMPQQPMNNMPQQGMQPPMQGQVPPQNNNQ